MEFLLIKLWEEILNSVSYGKYTTLNMDILMLLIGSKLKEVGGSWAKGKHSTTSL